MIYFPREDSYFFKENLQKYVKGKKVLDLGAGSGILSKSSEKAGASFITASDIDKKAIIHLKSINLKSIHSNLFSNIKEKFDVILFNPPYLPLDNREDSESRRITSGGKKGDEIILKFLKQSKKHLNKNGIILLLLSSFTPQNRIISLLKKLRFSRKQISKKSLFFEALYIWKIKKIKP